jgi:hypothetical protein
MRRGLIAMSLGLLLAACATASRPTSQVQDTRTVEEQQTVYQSRQPIPRFDFSQERDTLIQIYRLRQEARSTFTTFHSNGTGDVIFACPSRGYAIPADTQLTNSVQPYGYNNANYPMVTIDQPEPNGLYSSKNTDGTWVLCVRENGEVAPVYTELKVQTFPFEVTWDEARRMLLDQRKQSSSSLTIRVGQEAPAAAPSPIPGR